MVSKIFHIADVHIRNFKRHNEYRAVFKDLYKYIKDNFDENSLIYLAGDIVHSKNDMSPELVQMVAEFFTNCANIGPTILITGNHDTNLNNDSRLDALSPIVAAINHPNLMYWKDTGVYEFNEVKFSVFSVYGSPNDWILAKNIEGEYKIALHHGAVSTALTELNYEIENELVTPEIFRGFDLALLGDIHKRQYLDSNKTIAYAGSILQQNHGEDLDHGILVWDLHTKKSEYVPIENSIGYVTIEINDGKVITPQSYIDKFPKKLNLRIKHTNTLQIDILKFIESLKENHTILETNIIKINNINYLNNDKSIILGNVRDIEYQNQIICNYVNDFNIPVNLDSIRILNRTINSKLDNTNTIIRNVIWKPLKFEFSNMFSYNEDNVIDLSNFKGIQGLFAPNASGKSTLLDSITYCLFDKCSRTYRANDVLNNKKTNFRCKLTFQLNNEIYIVERIGEKNKTSGNIKVDVNFGKLVNGNYESLNDKDRDKTNRIIRGYIGTYDDFLLTALSTQNDNKNFIFKTQRERKDLLNSFLDIDIFEELHTIAKNDIRDNQLIIKKLETEIFQDEYTSLPTEIENIQNKFLHSSGSYLIEENNLIKIEKKLNSLKSQIQNIDEIINVETVINEINLNTDKITKLTESINNNYTLIETNKNNILTLEQQFEKIDYDKLQINKSELMQINSNLEKQKESYTKLSANLKYLKEQVSHLDSHEYDPNCKYCINNPFVQTASEAKIQLPSVIKEIDEITQKIKEFSDKRDYLKPIVESDEFNYSKLQNEIIQLKQSVDNLNELNKSNISLLKTIEEKIQYYKDREQKYYEQKNIQQNNINLNNEILQLESEYKTAKEEFKRHHSDMINYNSQLSVLNTKFNIWKVKNDELVKMYNETSIYESYIKCVNINGVPHMLLKKILPVIENEVNSILNQIVEFYITLEADDKNINCYLHYNQDTNWPVELASGMERFIISVAIRVALINVSTLPRPNFIAIDEGFGVLDSDKISSVSLLFDYLKTQFEFILCISHLDAMKDLADNLISINKTQNGFSEIRMI